MRPDSDEQPQQEEQADEEENDQEAPADNEDAEAEGGEPEAEEGEVEPGRPCCSPGMEAREAVTTASVRYTADAAIDLAIKIIDIERMT
jgi:hypothetical protein